MKKRNKYVTAVTIVIIALLYTGTVFADEVADPVGGGSGFQTGDLITADDMNARFNAINSLNKISNGVMKSTAGNIGIGTATPSSKLEIWTTARGDTFTPSSISTWVDVEIRNPIDDSNAAAGIMFAIESNGGYGGAGIAGVAEGTVSGTNPQGLAFMTVNGGANPAERMRINNDGLVGIGTSNPVRKFHIDSGYTYSGTDREYMIRLQTGGYNRWWEIGLDDVADDAAADFLLLSEEDFEEGKTYTAYCDADSGSWSGASDRRLKKEISSLKNTLDKIIELEPVSFYWKSNEDSSEKKDIGFISQDVDAIFPEYKIAEEKDNTWGLAYRNFGVLAIAGLKDLKEEKDREILEQKALVDAQQGEIDALKRENSDLKVEIQRIKEALGL